MYGLSLLFRIHTIKQILFIFYFLLIRYATAFYFHPDLYFL